MSTPQLTLNDGASIPQIGLGTWPLTDREAADTVEIALHLGYRHFDTAVIYHNEVGVGEGIHRSGIERSSVYVTTKLNREFQGYERAVRGLEVSLSRLKLDYVDLLLMHWPVPEDDLYVSTWKTFERVKELGLANSIGVSNFKPSHLDRLTAECGTVPAINQVELNPVVTRQAERLHHRHLGIATASWAPLGGIESGILTSPIVESLATARAKTPAQVVLRWHVEQGLIVIPKTSDPGRLAENIAIFDFQLSPEEMKVLSELEGPAGSGVDSDLFGL